MKAYISVDLEGMPYVVIPGHLKLKGAQYEEVRKITTKLTLVVVNALHEAGFEEIINSGIEIAEKGSDNEFEIYGVRE